MKWMRVLLCTLGLIILVVLTGWFLVTSDHFHRYLLARAEQEIGKATGAKVNIKRLSLHLFGPSAEFDQLVLRGTEPPGDRPLFTADHIFVGLDLRSILRRKIRLTKLVLDRPVFNLLVDKEGHSNIPRPTSAAEKPSAGATSRLDLFSLAVRHLQLNQGELYFNDRQVSVGADLQEVVLTGQFTPANAEYAGSLSYSQGAVKYNDWNTLHHNLSLQFVATASGLTVNELALSTESSKLSLHGELQDYANPTFKADYEMVLDTQDLRHIRENTSLPRGKVRSNGSLAYTRVAGRSWLQSLTAWGDLRSTELLAESPYFHSRLRSFRGRYRLADGNLEASDLHADLLQGQASAALNIHDLPGDPHFLVQGSFQNLSLDAIKAAAPQDARGFLIFSGRMSGKFKADWRHLNQLLLRSDLDLTASPATDTADGTGKPVIPVRGKVHFEYRADRDTLKLDQTSLQTPHSEMHLSGTLGHHSRLLVAAKTHDLQEAAHLLTDSLHLLSPASAGRSNLSALGLKGAATFDGSVEGSFKSPILMGTLAATDFEVRGTRWQNLRAKIILDAAAAVLQSGLITGPGGRGHVELEGRAQLTNGAYQKTNPLKARLTIAGLPVDTFQQLGGIVYPVEGLIFGTASIQGTLDHPVAEGQINLRKIQAWDQPVEKGELKFQADGESIQAKLEVRAEPGAVSGAFVYRLQDRMFQLSVHAPKIQLNKLAAVRARNLALSGDLNVSLTGSGPWSSPQWQLAVQVPQLQAWEESLQNVTLQANVVNRQAQLRLTSTASGAAIEAAGSVNLTGDYPIDLSLRTGNLALSPLLASYLPRAPRELTGQAELHGWLRGPLRQPQQLQGQVDVISVSLTYQSLQLNNQNPLRLTYAKGVLSLDAFELTGNGSKLQVRGVLPLSSPSPLNLTVHGDVNLKLLNMFDAKAASSGQLKLEIRARGSWSQPQVEGDLSIANAAFSTNRIPTGLDNINAKLAVHGGRLTIEQFSADSGGGRLSASGFISYRPHLTFNVVLQGDSVRIRYPHGVRSLVDCNLNLTGTLAEPRLTGRVLINRLSLTNEFDLDTFASQLSGPSISPSGPGFASRLRLNVQIESTQELSLASSKLSLQGSANLRAGGTAANPVIVGRAVMKGGDIFFLGQRYEIQRGIVDFSNPGRTEPAVNLLVTTSVDQYDLSINLVGPLDRLRTHYTSDPPLPAADIINLLAFGKTGEAAATASKVPTTLGAESLLAKGVTSQLSNRVERLVGLSHLQISPLLGGSQRNPGARLAIQQRIAGNLVLTYATDIRTTQNELIQVEYQATPRLSISIIRDANGGIAADFRFRKSF